MSRRVLRWATYLTGALWMADVFGLISLPYRVVLACSVTYLILAGIDGVLDWRARKIGPDWGMSPAVYAVGTIGMMGATAVMITAMGAHSTSAYMIPVAIAIVTAGLALAAFRLAPKSQRGIGEARFDTTSSGG